MGMKKNTNSKIFIGSNTKFLELTLKKCIVDSKEDYCKDIESRVQAFIWDQTHYSTFTVWFFTSFSKTRFGLRYGFWKNWWKSIVIWWRARSPSKELKKCNKLIKHGKNKTYFAMWMITGKTFSTYGHKKGEAILMLSYTLVTKKKKVTKVAMKNLPLKKANQMLFNGLAHCNRLMLSNSPFIMARPEIWEKNATAKDFFNVLIDDAYIDEIVQ